MISIPKTLDDAVKMLIKELAPWEQKAFAKEPENCPGAKYHFTVGMAIRNAWGLWANKTPIAQYLNNHGIVHGDDRTGVIFKALWCKLNKKKLDIKKEAKFYEDYWKQENR